MPLEVSLTQKQITKAEHDFGTEVTSLRDKDELSLVQDGTQNFEKLTKIKAIEYYWSNKAFHLSLIEQLIGHQHCLRHRHARRHHLFKARDIVIVLCLKQVAQLILILLQILHAFLDVFKMRHPLFKVLFFYVIQ